ncbi:hypothetical protein [Microbulbifer sp. JMSA008]|uniref:hypothetical protein n=1 Tax=Microbulbifer sp. JMSA008 TaxID=3243373 RepID=UPI004039F69C
MSDIFILPKYRSQGVASKIARGFMLKEIGQLYAEIYQGDTFALQFWEGVL